MARSQTASLVVTLKDRATKKLESIELRMQSLAKTALKRAPIALAASTAALGYFTKKTLDATLQIQKNAQASGLSIETYQALEGTLQAAGISTRNLVTAMRTLEKQAADAFRGEGNATKLFQQLGVEVTDASGRMKDGEQILFEVSDALAAMGSETRKAGIGSQLMGRAFSETRGILAQGSAELRRHIDAAKTAGQVLDEELVRRGAAAASALDNLGQATTAAARELVLELAPAIKAVGDALNDQLSARALDTLFDKGEKSAAGFAAALRQAEEATLLQGAPEVLNALGGVPVFGTVFSAMARSVQGDVDKTGTAMQQMGEIVRAVESENISAIAANEAVVAAQGRITALQEKHADDGDAIVNRLQAHSDALDILAKRLKPLVAAEEGENRLKAQASEDAVALTQLMQTQGRVTELERATAAAAAQSRFDELEAQREYHRMKVEDLELYLEQRGLTAAQEVELETKLLDAKTKLRQSEQQLAQVTSSVTIGAIKNTMAVLSATSNRQNVDSERAFKRQQRRDAQMAWVQGLLAAQQQYTANSMYPAPIPQLAAAAALAAAKERVDAIKSAKFGGGIGGGSGVAGSGSTGGDAGGVQGATASGTATEPTPLTNTTIYLSDDSQYSGRRVRELIEQISDENERQGRTGTLTVLGGSG